MAFNTKNIKTDASTKPIPQYFNVSPNDDFEVLQGAGGASWVTLYDGSGNAVAVVSNKLAVRASELEALMGEVQASPTANTVLDRLKVLATLLSGGLPATLTAGGGLKAGLVDAIPAGNNNIGDVDVASSALPTGASTSANQTTIIGYIDGLETLITAIKDTAGIKKITDALPAGTNTIGAVKVAGNDTMLQGNITLTGLAQQLHANTAAKTVTIQAEPTNNGFVYVGKSDVSGTVHMATLSAGSSMTFYVSNLNLLYVIGTSGDKVCYGGEV